MREIRVVKEHENAHGRFRPGQVVEWPTADAEAAVDAGLAVFVPKPPRKGKRG